MLFFLLACTTPDMRMTSAKRNSQAYAEQMGIEITGSACSGSDSDRDGYVSCNLRTSTGQTLKVECGYDEALTVFGNNTGCKEWVPERAIVENQSN